LSDFVPRNIGQVYSFFTLKQCVQTSSPKSLTSSSKEKTGILKLETRDVVHLFLYLLKHSQTKLHFLYLLNRMFSAFCMLLCDVKKRDVIFSLCYYHHIDDHAWKVCGYFQCRDGTGR